jgi:hypothetical protein
MVGRWRTSQAGLNGHVRVVNVWLVLAILMAAPQKHRDRPLGNAVGIFVPVSCIAYFHAVQRGAAEGVISNSPSFLA